MTDNKHLPGMPWYSQRVQHFLFSCLLQFVSIFRNTDQEWSACAMGTDVEKRNLLPQDGTVWHEKFFKPSNSILVLMMNPEELLPQTEIRVVSNVKFPMFPEEEQEWLCVPNHFCVFYLLLLCSLIVFFPNVLLICDLLRLFIYYGCRGHCTLYTRH